MTALSLRCDTRLIAAIMSRWAYRGVLLASGLFLLGLGGWFLASGLGYVFGEGGRALGLEPGCRRG